MSETEGAIVPILEDDIGDFTYSVYQLSLLRWAELTEHLAKMLGGPFATALRSGNIDPDVLADGDVMALALASVMERLTAKNLLTLLDFATGAQGGGKRNVKGAMRLDGSPRKQAQWHDHFERNMAHLAPAIGLFLRAQYADFIEGLRTLRSEPQTVPEDHAESTAQNSTESRST